MNCPRCSRELQSVSVGGVTVDACQDGCGGIWFDLFELEKMDQPDESAGWLLDNMRIELETSIDVDQPVSCPRCEGVTLMRQKYPRDPNIMIDKCQACGGIWLDFGELFEIRSGNPSSAETRATTAELLTGLRGTGSA